MNGPVFPYPSPQVAERLWLSTDSETLNFANLFSALISPVSPLKLLSMCSLCSRAGSCVPDGRSAGSRPLCRILPTLHPQQALPSSPPQHICAASKRQLLLGAPVALVTLQGIREYAHLSLCSSRCGCSSHTHLGLGKNVTQATCLIYIEIHGDEHER